MDAMLELFDTGRREFHLDRYRFAAERLKGQRVIDCACGTGYGVRLLRESGAAAYVLGLDNDPAAIRYARSSHQVSSTAFLCSSGERLAIADGLFDAATSFETIEHVADDRTLLHEIHRVLRPGGTLIISTPNQWPLASAPYHVREYDRASFVSVLREKFEDVVLFNQNSGCDSPYNHQQPRGIVATSAQNEHLAECYIAVCRANVSRS
jgi:2-polyprenyl-3-methyl-5-hydroxy-6-metoxy-1,4-benzoquinol methylase